MEHHSPKRLDINTYKILNIPTLYSKHPQKIRVCILYLTSENLLAQCIVLQQFSKAFLWYLNLKPMVNKSPCGIIILLNDCNITGCQWTSIIMSMCMTNDNGSSIIELFLQIS